MKPAVICCVLSVASCLQGCATPRPLVPDPDFPLTVGNGLGSRYGNYASRPDGEEVLPGGERCKIYVWDRPISRDLVLRLRSASCPSTERPGRFVARELSRSVIPFSDSHLKDDLRKAAQ